MVSECCWCVKAAASRGVVQTTCPLSLVSVDGPVEGNLSASRGWGGSRTK